MKKISIKKLSMACFYFTAFFLFASCKKETSVSPAQNTSISNGIDVSKLVNKWWYNTKPPIQNGGITFASYTSYKYNSNFTMEKKSQSEDYEGVVGSWKISGDTLHLTDNTEQTAPIWKEKIIKLTSDTLVVEFVGLNFSYTFASTPIKKN
jgi:hypothetical protein